MSKIVKSLPIKISQKKVLDSREASPKWVSNPKSVKKIHIFQKKKGEKTRIMRLKKKYRVTQKSVIKDFNVETPCKLYGYI